jgi:phosphoribosyl 1,2-cyclic phosphate phosphodiesterase
VSLKLTILGCGASAGVPIVGCECAVCHSDNPKNKRLRASVIFENATGNKLLIDASPDLRTQALNNNITNVDGLIITHAHADHCHGIDDFRPFNFAKNAAIDLATTQATMQELKERFAYVFKPHQLQYGWYKPAFNERIVESDAEVEIAGMNVKLFEQTHGRIKTLGVRMGDIAYSTDVNHLNDKAFAALKGVKIWVVDCLRYNPAPTHAHLELTLKWIERLRPERAILTHMAHEMDYEELKSILPENVEPAYDGMVLTV